MDEKPRRRTVLGATASGIVITLAGCLGADDEEIEADTYGDWFDGAQNFEGTVDETNSDEVTVLVGAGQGGLAYDPAAVRITTGTTVVWEWTGDGGGHNVVEEDDAFESEMKTPPDSEGETFSHIFEETGVYRYRCTPHIQQGMLGAVEVVDEDTDTDANDDETDDSGDENPESDT